MIVYNKSYKLYMCFYNLKAQKPKLYYTEIFVMLQYFYFYIIYIIAI